MLHVETANFPITLDFEAALKSSTTQMLEFKTSNKYYFFHYLSKFITTVVPTILDPHVSRSANAQGGCVTLTNLQGPQAPLRLGNEA